MSAAEEQYQDDSMMLDNGEGFGGSRNSRRSCGRLQGARNYSKQMVMVLLNIIDEILPFDVSEWEKVADRFNFHFQDHRHRRSIKRKFMEMVNDKKATLANVPDEIRRAKTIHIKIMNRRKRLAALGKTDLEDPDDDESSTGSMDDANYEQSMATVAAEQVLGTIPAQKPESFRARVAGLPVAGEAGVVDDYVLEKIYSQVMRFMEQQQHQYVYFQQQIMSHLEKLHQQQQQLLLDLADVLTVANANKRRPEDITQENGAIAAVTSNASSDSEEGNEAKRARVV